jgi:hypothetical protein
VAAAEPDAAMAAAAMVPAHGPAAFVRFAVSMHFLGSPG